MIVNKINEVIWKSKKNVKNVIRYCACSASVGVNVYLRLCDYSFIIRVKSKILWLF